MFPIFILFILVLILSGITTIPFAIALLASATVLFKKSWVFFAAFLLGLFLDLTLIRPLGYTSLMFAIFVFVIGLYERKFETKTLTFVFISTFLGSLTYLLLFGYNQVLMQALISALFAIVLFRFVIPNLFQDLVFKK